MANFFTSSIGKKILMAGLGLFLIIFLLVHLGINLLLVLSENRDAFNLAAHFMATNIVIKIFEILLFGGLLLHSLYGVIVQIQNWFARPVGYKKTNNSETSFFSKFMIYTAVIVLIFLVLHLLDFYLKAKFFNGTQVVMINGKEYEDLGLLVIKKFQLPGYIIFYIACFVILGFHLLHGFQSAFQTIGLNHKIYTPVVKTLGVLYTIFIVTGFTLIPLLIYFTHNNI